MRVVLLHGLGQSADVWDPIVAELPGEWTVEAPSLYGRTSWEDLLEAVSEAVGIGLAVVCGLSMGAMLGVEFAARHPESVVGLHASGVELHVASVPARLRRAWLRLTAGKKIRRNGLPNSVVLDLDAALDGVDLREIMREVRVPTRVLVGERDTDNTKDARLLAAAVPGAELVIVPGAGHEWNKEMPAKYAADIENFVRRVIAGK